MNDDGREGIRKNKPQQQLYRPGSGPLKKSPVGQDEEIIVKQEFTNSTMQDSSRRGNPHGRHQNHNRGHHHNRYGKDDQSDRRSYDNEEHKPFPPRRQDQQFYSSKFAQSGDNGNRSPSPQHQRNNRFDESNEVRSKRYSGNRRHDGDDFRRDGRIQNSEPRHMSPPHKNINENHHNRGRDTRSMDSSRYHSNGNKPPSGRRSSGMNINLDSVPPRFRKQFLAKNGQLNNEVQQTDNTVRSGTFFGQASWSQTLPTRGRGRLREDNNMMDKDRLRYTHHLQTFESGSDSRSSTPHSLMLPPPPMVGRPPHFTGSQENIHSDKSSNYYPYQQNEEYSGHPYQQQNYNRNQNVVFNNKQPNANHSVNDNVGDTMYTNRGADLNRDAVQTSNSGPEQPTTNRLLETLTSSIKNLTVECEQVSLEWSTEVEKPINFTMPPPILCQDLPGESNHRMQQEQAKIAADNHRGGNNFNSNVRSHGNGDNDRQQHDRNNPNIEGGNRQSHGRGDSKSKNSGRNPRRRRRNGGVRKRNSGNRSSSRGSQIRELSNEAPHRRTDRSPHSQGQLREFRDNFRESKEQQQQQQHHHNNDAINRETGRGHNYGRTDSYNEQDHPPSRNNWNRSQFSRENSRDRYSYSRASSGERAPYVGGGGSRAESRERQAQGRGGRADSEGFRLPPPMGGRSRNQNRRDSWTSRGSRHASVESGCGGDVSPPPSSRGGGSGGGRRRRRRDSDHRHAGATPAPSTNWREEMHHNESAHNRRDMDSNKNMNPPDSGSHPVKGLAPGILVLPHDTSTSERSRTLDTAMDYHHNRGNMPTNPTSPQSQTVQRTLFNPSNPSKPIVVSQSMITSTYRPPPHAPVEPQHAARPSYYDVNSESFMSAHNKDLIREIEKADIQLQWIFKNGTIVRDWDKILQIRPFLQCALKMLLETDLKFCEAENVEHNFWKMLYYSYIEIMRKSIAQDEANKRQYKELINSIIADGNSYFESLLELLQTTYEFKLEDYLNISYQNAPKGSSYVSLALISAQKIYLFLGDLARYKELINETTNYAKSKSWYTKAHQINPKNGRPYNQLAILAVYARRRLDAAYFYMRSLMSSNPCHSAQESLNALFDENRKKFETNERKRQAEKQKALEAALANVTVTTSTTIGGSNSSSGWRGSLRKEIWSRPGRTTTLLQPEKPDIHSDEEELANMTSVELNKRFVISYLHVHGKLITRIGMETFASSAGVMLRQFGALLRHSPLPINCGRLIQLTALNMFAIDTAHLKDASHSENGPVCRRALAVALRMFGTLLGRCCTLLSLPLSPDQPLPVHEDVLVILPALKVWSDWMLFHSSVWNPPPPSDDFDAGLDSDPWEQLARLMNLLEPLDLQSNLVTEIPEEGHDMVKLSEDTQLSGFTPLMYGTPTNWYAPKILEPEIAQLAARARALLFLGKTFLCGTDPPALERRLNANGVPEFISVVQSRASEDEIERRNSVDDSDVIEASLSECEETNEKEEVPPLSSVDWAVNPDEEQEDEATKKLLRRRGELENKRQDLEKRRIKMQSLLKKGQVSVELDVQPKYLVPDTNCFIDHLSRLQKIISAEAGSPYTLVVPLVVVSELEGLTRAARVAEDARAALNALKTRRPALRFATTRGNLLHTPAFTAEKDGDELLSNDDKILNTSLCFCKDSIDDDSKNGETKDAVRKLVREVVLLTEDRNLRVKALSRDLPVRDLPAFMRWADLD